MGLTITDNSLAFRTKVALSIDTLLGLAAADIERLAKMNVPQKTSRLQNTIVHQRIDRGHWIVPANTPYARRWEYNESLTDSLGRHYGPAHFNNGRTDHYLEKAGSIVAEQFESRIKIALGYISL